MTYCCNYCLKDLHRHKGFSPVEYPDTDFCSFSCYEKWKRINHARDYELFKKFETEVIKNRVLEEL